VQICKCCRRANEPWLARLNVLRTITETLANQDREAVRIDVGERTIHANAPPRLQIDTEQPDRSAAHEIYAQWICQRREPLDTQPSRIRGANETWSSDQYRTPGAVTIIEATCQDESKLREELTILIEHELVDDPTTDSVALLARSGARLHRSFACVEW
jgi:hypothetical protein